jgi:hypothetical protein
MPPAGWTPASKEADTAAAEIGVAMPPAGWKPAGGEGSGDDEADEAGPLLPGAGPAAAAAGSCGDPAAAASCGDSASAEGAKGAEGAAGGGGGPRRVGPALPVGVDLAQVAAASAAVDWQRVAMEEEEDDDDLCGPALPGQATTGCPPPPSVLTGHVASLTPY